MRRRKEQSASWAIDPLRTAEAYSVISRCFGGASEAEWTAMTECRSWAGFLEACRVATGCGSLSECLAARAVEALHNPPSYQEYRTFCAQHFTGGLPQSAMPVESLYRDDSNLACSIPFSAHASGAYGGESARYMGDMIVSMGLTLPDAFRAYPDHLSLETDMVAVMLRSGMVQQAGQFAQERFGWLTHYRLKLLSLPNGSCFFVALVDVVLSAIEHLGEVIPAHAQEPSAINAREEQSCQITQ